MDCNLFVTDPKKSHSAITERFLGKQSKEIVFLGIFPIKGDGFGIPKLYVKFWWPLFLPMVFTFLFLNLAKIQISISKSAYLAKI